MSLVDLEMSDDESNTDPAAPDAPRFPFGLSLSLNDEMLGRLGIDSLPSVGAKMIVAGVGEVTDVSERQGQEGADRSVTIQLQRAEVGPLENNTALDAIDDALEDV